MPCAKDFLDVYCEIPWERENFGEFHGEGKTLNSMGKCKHCIPWGRENIVEFHGKGKTLGNSMGRENIGEFHGEGKTLGNSMGKGKHWGIP